MKNFEFLHADFAVEFSAEQVFLLFLNFAMLIWGESTSLEQVFLRFFSFHMNKALLVSKFFEAFAKFT